MKRQKIKEIILIFLTPVLFLTIGTAVLKDYGFNWDEPWHFMRGQAYLHFFLSGGEKDFRSLPPYPRLGDNCFDITDQLCSSSPKGPGDIENYTGKNLVFEDAIKSLYPKDSSIWRSYFQNDNYDYNTIINTEGGHPALNDIFAAFSNYVFFQRLHLLGDLEAYHFFEIFAAFLIVLGVSYFVYHKLGIFAAIVSGASLSLYPLFFSESHFNVKDPPETAFFGLTIILFYFGVTKNNWKLIIASAVFSALALGTKFNAIFIAPILGIWLIFYLITLLISKGRKIISKNNLKKILPLILSLIVYPVITLGIFYILWPYLWADPVKNITVIINYYRQIGTGVPSESANYLVAGWNTYPILWIIYTTPIPILFLAAVGGVTAFFSVFKKNHFALLVLVWFIAPILRVSVPKSVIYGGIRQIMEFVPAMAVLAGIGAWFLIKAATSVNGKVLPKLMALGVAASLLFVVYEMVKIHPNENVYFNQIIGGLSGARAKNIPSWGNAFGNVYLQGVKWLNDNAEPNAKLGMAVTSMSNVPKLKLRTDIIFFNGYWSGPNHQGEYTMEMDYDWWPKLWYSFQYYDVFMTPVYEAKVDGVPLLKIWKNDLRYVKPGYREEINYYPISTQHRKTPVSTQLFIDLGKEINLTRITIRHDTNNCLPQSATGFISLSVDNKVWSRESEPINSPQVPTDVINWSDRNFVFLFAAKKARYIIIDPQVINGCLLNNPQIEMRGLKKTL